MVIKESATSTTVTLVLHQTITYNNSKHGNYIK